MKTRSRNKQKPERKIKQKPERKIKQKPQNINLSEHFKMKLSTIQKVLGDYIRKKVSISKSRAKDLLKEVTAIHGSVECSKHHNIQQVTEKQIRQLKTIIEENDTNLTHYPQLQAEDISRNVNSNMQSEELRSSQSTPSDIGTIENLGNGLKVICINDTKVDKKRGRPKLLNVSAKNKTVKNKENKATFSRLQDEDISRNINSNMQSEELRSSQSTPSDIETDTLGNGLKLICINDTKVDKRGQPKLLNVSAKNKTVKNNDKKVTFSRLQAEDISRNINSNMQSEELRSSQSTPSDIETMEKLDNGLKLICINDTKVDKKRGRPKLLNESAKNKIVKNKDMKAKGDNTYIQTVAEKITQPLTTIRERNYRDYNSYKHQQVSESFYPNTQTNEAEELRSSQSTPSNIDPAENAKPTQSEWEQNEASSNNQPGLGSSADKHIVGSISSTHNAENTSSIIMYSDANIELSRNDGKTNSNSQSILSGYREIYNGNNWISDNQSIHLNKICSQDAQNTPKMSDRRSVIQKVSEHKEKLNITSVVIAKAAADTGYTCNYNSEKFNENVNHAYANRQKNNFEVSIKKDESGQKRTGLYNRMHIINDLKSVPILTANVGNNYGKNIRNTSLEMEILTNLSKPIQKHTNGDIENFQNCIPSFKITNENNFPMQIYERKNHFTEFDILKNTNMSEKTQVQPFSDSVNTIPDSNSNINSGTNYALPKLFAKSNETSTNGKLPKNIATTIKNAQVKPITNSTALIENLENVIPNFKITNGNALPMQISERKGNFTDSDILKNTNMSEKTQVQPFSDSVNTIPDSQYIDSGSNSALPKLFATSNKTSKSNIKVPKKKIAKTTKNAQRKPRTNSKANELLENNSTGASFGKNVSSRNKNNEVKESSWLENLQFVRCIEPEEYSSYCDDTFWREFVTFPGLCHDDFTD